ncbi:MAG: molybdopterin-dependent oxidoreductase [Patescibacteria group bacterium]
MDIKNVNYYKFIIFGFLAVVIIILFYSFYNQSGYNSRVAPELIAKEINNYEGEDLSSINDFRENSIKGPQYINRDDYRLKISGTSETGVEMLSYDDIINNNQSYKEVITLNCVEGWSVKILWEGILVKDLIKRENIPSEVNTIIFKAYDGYSTSFPIEYIYDNDIMLAFKMNGVELPPERGWPFQLVAESKYGYKWIKWITEIEFSTDSNYRGYWESRGYSDSAEIK